MNLRQHNEAKKGPDPEDLETGFKGILEDVIVVVERLAPLCANSDELTALLRHALDNPAQLRLVMNAVRENKK